MAAKQDSESTRNVIATNDTMDKPSIITSGVNLYHHIFCMMMRSVMVTVYGRRGKSMPPIDDLLLLDSATIIAEKIRTKQVKLIKYYKSNCRFYHDDQKRNFPLSC